jgi:GNAT superfamily N-acetyltransferase
MSRFRLSPRIDLGVYYDADAPRYDVPGGNALQIVTRELFIARYRDCASIGFECDGQPIGGVIFDGEQAHIAVLPAYRGRWATLLRPMLGWLFSLKREIFVDVEADNAVCLEFMRRNGWPIVSRRERWLTHRMTQQRQIPRERRLSASCRPAAAPFYSQDL